MRRIALLILLIVGTYTISFAQQRLNPNGMNYYYNPKPNNIIYHDSLFRGSVQFQQLFYRQGNIRLMNLYQKHQSNKIAAQVLGIVGAVATVVGISVVSSTNNNKGAGWALIGGGFATTLTAGYLVLMSQRNLQLAVDLFNAQNHKAVLGIGVGDKKAGLVFNF
jgi:hypothetical protein